MLDDEAELQRAESAVTDKSSSHSCSAQGVVLTDLDKEDPLRLLKHRRHGGIGARISGHRREGQ